MQINRRWHCFKTNECFLVVVYTSIPECSKLSKSGRKFISVHVSFFFLFFSLIYLFIFDRHLVGNEYFKVFVSRQDNFFGATLVISQPIFISYFFFWLCRKLTLIKIFKPFRKLIQKRPFSAINFVDKVVHTVWDCGSAVEAEESDLQCIFALG